MCILEFLKVIKEIDFVHFRKLNETWAELLMMAGRVVDDTGLSRRGQLRTSSILTDSIAGIIARLYVTFSFYWRFVWTLSTMMRTVIVC